LVGPEIGNLEVELMDLEMVGSGTDFGSASRLLPPFDHSFEVVVD